ncbi:TetR/AcrR family transcriptional regulator [Novosphingobium hassiacum]|nr:TetR/AcrR family transcriptional regulator [Novosphingobium hassiacum]
MTSNSGHPLRPRGRPRRDRREDVPETLIRALEDLLANRPADALTLRDIAAAAGTSPEMVRYYFNGKEGLIAALLDESLVRVRDRLDGLTADLARAKQDHTRQIVDCLSEIYLRERLAGKLFNAVFVHDRAGRRLEDRAGRPDTIVAALHAVIDDLKERGHYRPSVDTGRAAIMIMSLTGCPVRLLETLDQRWIDEGRLGDPQWNADVAAMIERFCCP